MTGRPPAAEPKPGQLIRYAYLWREEAERGQEEGTKDRPCAVVLATRREGARTIVYVAPITHAPPTAPRNDVEIPAETKRRLRLDEARSWIVTDELNRFTWPGPDVRLVTRSGGRRGFVYGVLPTALTRQVVDIVLKRVREVRAKVVHRDEPPAPPTKP